MSIPNIIPIADVNDIDYSPIHIGKSWITNEPVYWDFAGASHPSMLILGKSGVGKTYSLKKLTAALCRRGLAVHVFDSHGDLDSPELETFNFGYTSPYGVNPFSVDPNRDFGGPKSTITSITALLSSQHKNMGQLQVAMLSHLSERLYEKNGFDLKDPGTWHSKAFGIHDLINEIEGDILHYKTTVKKSLIDKVMGLSERMRKLDKLLSSEEVLTNFESEKYNSEYDDCSREWEDAVAKSSPQDFGSVLDRIRSGFSEKGMQSILLILRELASTGIFDGQEPMPSGKSMRYVVRGLASLHQVLLIETILQRIFGYHARNMKDLNGPPHTFIIIDEVKLMTGPAFKDPMHIINRIMTEARKYGIAVIFVGQNITHLPPDALQNFGTTMVLPVHKMSASAINKAYGIDEATIQRMQPRRDGMISVDGQAFELCGLWQ